ncbi:hypothetical protein FF36_00378 [Frankia torreyi]|uniref:Uncharacterized protein n=1 Tax=Frankia torreyi TaxID=1856 RepID=A0A0D8BME3_9ACTN|nr:MULTISPECIES: hypothetical protein [Frankia]KJE25245.1 hypothetical protein FF36_00378 [Frankia torreyi]KQC37762.1 hypothetical protein UK82_14255 [Frankia sp. ACN1ag]KQM07939.1 hypothetical protein FF86_1001195 [Frankia sp. CpI1-P]
MHQVDPRAEQIERGGELARGGRRQAARGLLAAVWRQLSPVDDAPLRADCALAMAALQDDQHDRLAWLLRALHAGEQVRESYVARRGLPLPLPAFYPTVLRDLADAYRLVGDDVGARACEQRVAAGVAGIRRLGDVALQEIAAFAVSRMTGRHGVPMPVQDPWAR